MPSTVLQHHAGPKRVDREIDDDLDPFCHRQADGRKDDWRRQQPLVGSNLNQRMMRAQCQAHGARIRGIENAEAVLPRRDFQDRPGRAVHQHHATGRAVMRVMVVVELTVGRECAIVKHQGNIVRTVRQLPLDLGVLLQQVKTGETHVEISSGPTPAVIVIPERRRPSNVVVLVGACFSRSDGIDGEAIRLRARHAAMQMRHGRNAQPVRVRHHSRPSAAGLDRRAGKDAVIAPDTRAHPGDDLDRRFALGDLVVVGRRVAPDRLQDRGRGSGLRNCGIAGCARSGRATARWNKAAEPRTRSWRRVSAPTFAPLRPGTRSGSPSELQRPPASSGPRVSPAR